jgi:hypothetical protein
MLIRFYYNLGRDRPYVGAYDLGTSVTEVKVKEIVFGGKCVSKFQLGAKPCFWMECDGTVEVLEGVAYIKGM